MSSAFRPVVIVLASGRGERFIESGGTVHKLKAPLAGKPVLEHTIDAVRASGLPMHLVNSGLAGMGDSIAHGVRATCGACGWLVLPGDLPLINARTLLTIACELESCNVVVPVYQGQRGHPVGFGAICRDDLLCLHGDTDAASIATKYAPKLPAVDDLGAVHDVDTLTDFAFAEQIVLKRAVN